ncbi:MAG: hypothetical protein NTX53_05085 [candidate division WOR-3 bacterium]|nr:hypothetical protein [candidate division WOR-3 bacterium]
MSRRFAARGLPPGWPRAFVTVCTLLLALSCGQPKRGFVPVGARPPGGSTLDARTAQIARELSGTLKPGSRVVVANFGRLGTDRTSALGTYLGRRFSIALHSVAAGRITVIDRSAGEEVAIEEMRFAVDRIDPRELLKRFEADYAVVGTYELREGECALELVELKAIPKFDAEVAFGKSCLVEGGPSEYGFWQDMEHRKMPVVGRKMVELVNAQGTLGALRSARLTTLDGRVIPANGKVEVGAELKVQVEVAKECHLYVLGWDSDNGFLTVLSPKEGENSLTGAGMFEYPRGTFARADLPAGYNWLKVVATTKEIGLVSTGEGFLSDAKLQDEYAKRILDLGPEGWGSISFGYSIVERE